MLFMLCMLSILDNTLLSKFKDEGQELLHARSYTLATPNKGSFSKKDLNFDNRDLRLLNKAPNFFRRLQAILATNTRRACKLLILPNVCRINKLG